MMKTHLTILTTTLLFISVVAFGQTRLSDSRRNSVERYIYRISKDDLRKMHLQNKKIEEDMLRSLVNKIPLNGNVPKLPRGNYVIVKAEGNQLVYTDHIVDDLYFKIVTAEKMMLCLYDSLGNIVDDATVRCGSKAFKFNRNTQTYNIKNTKDKQIIEVNNKGVYHYIEIEKQSPYHYKSNLFKTIWGKMKYNFHNLFNPNDRPTKNKYKGFIVFNKPKYKPGETVKLKAYMTNHNGKPYDKAVDLKLLSYYPNKIDTTLANLMPYRQGMYTYQFKLSDNLNLKLDNNYTIALKTIKDRDNEVTSQFRYEDYELKSLHFTAQTNKEEYEKGDSIKLKFKVTDENEMAVYDGKIEILVTPDPFDQYKMKKSQSVFIPDTLWTQTIDMNGLSEKEIILPDSIFPANVSINYQAKCTYLSADNEKRTLSKRLSQKADDYTIDFSLSKGILMMKELNKGQSQEIMAEISVDGENGSILSVDSVMLPHSMPVSWIASDVTVKTKHTTKTYFLDDIREDQLAYKFYRQNDSIYLIVDNPAQIPFWYAVRKKNKEIAKGYTTQLNYSVKAKSEEGYSMQLSYLFGEESKNIRQSLPFTEKNISIDVSTPTSVYPGQKANILISVTDKKRKPVSNVDVTAYSFTSKFESYSMPDLAIKGKYIHAKAFADKRYNPEENSIAGNVDMQWGKWKNTMALDTIEYYKFLYPNTYYSYAEPSIDGTTQISPYIVIDGVLQGVHMLWIDQRLYYFDQAQQLDVYSFCVTPGKHNLKFRTHDREILVYNVNIQKGAKNILSFDAKTPYVRKAVQDEDTDPFVLVSKLLKKKEQNELNEKEVEQLSSQLITVNNTFGRLDLPNLRANLELPAYISSGNIHYYLNNTPRNSYNNTLRGSINSAILAGPFPSRNSMNGITNMASLYIDDKLVSNIEIEGGNEYLLYNNYQKIKSWNALPFQRSISKYIPKTNFKEQLLTPSNIREQFNKRLITTLSSSNGSANFNYRHYNKCRLSLYLGKDTKGLDIKPSLILIVPEKKEEIKDYQLFYGGTRNFNSLSVGNMVVTIALNDSTSYSKIVTLHPNGQNYLRLDSIEYDTNSKLAKTAFNLFQRDTRKVFSRNPYINNSFKIDSIISVPAQETGSYKRSNARKGIITGIVYDNFGEPIIGASATINKTKVGTITDLDGYFELAGKAGDEITFTYIGYIPKKVKYSEGYNYKIVLNEDSQSLQEVVVVGYGSEQKSLLTGSTITINDNSSNTTLDSQTLQGRIAGLTIRGSSSDSKGSNPLILVNGLPYNGKLEDIDATSIISLNILKDNSATAIYGARAKDGVIMIQTKTLNTVATEKSDNAESTSTQGGNTMRRNFHDDAFWQPTLKTNIKGEASFDITYPDDITTWNAYFIAIGNKKQTDKKQMTIKSFKALTARLSTPRFAIRGDSLNAVGRITNHFGDTIEVDRSIDLKGSIQQEKIKLLTSHIDYIPVKAKTGDSLTISYSLKMQNGYFDGEEQSIPIFEQGMLQTHGDFRVINDTTSHTLNIDPALGITTIHAEVSSLEVFLREIDKIDSYPYMCNEQMASKIKAMLSKKRIAKILGKEFKDDQKINNLISSLNKNRNSEGLWGWWNKEKAVSWISKQVISAMLDAENAGYKTNLNKNSLCNTFEAELKDGLSNLRLTTPDRIPLAKQELLDRLMLLKRMNAPIDYVLYFKQINEQLKSLTVTDRLKSMLTMSIIGLKDQINIDTLMQYSRKTMLGGMYWGIMKEGDTQSRSFMLPYENNTENTLIAYTLLKNIGGHESDLNNIRNYFFEHRQGSSWQNTYESSRIIETVMPDMLSENDQYKETSIYVNERRILKFPYTEQIESKKNINIKKEGTLPLFVTAYQQEWNKKPLSESKKGFTVKTIFMENKDTISSLKAGKVAKLQVSVKVDADAEYVQIEIPIPAGCSYETKKRGDYWQEVHREYFKEKIVIFSNKLTKGEHHFTIELIPRYTGKYSLNPAKAELMYFPTFYGNEQMKSVMIE
nr:alpha-2-macroglobulin family protein [uncultured Bacteroides sp.]